MRCSSVVALQMPIAFGMIMMPPTPVNTIWWQWVNQTYCAVFNYGNRNASSTYTSQDIIKSYASAVTVAIGLSLGIRRMFAARVAVASGAKLVLMNSFSTYIACGCAGFTNAFLMR